MSTASRWTKGNFLFPTRLVISSQRVSRVKSRWFGNNEESIAISKVASVHISTGMVFADIRIESFSGTDPSPATAIAKPKPNASATSSKPTRPPSGPNIRIEGGIGGRKSGR